eukprot:m.242167 g.242167  ORF g.242167 m.242167 type:complete len:232 (+) comp22536_c0_seq10:3456-4151(+)
MFVLFSRSTHPQVASDFTQAREALELRTVIVLYNVAMVALNFHIAYELLWNGWKLDYGVCAAVDTSDNPYSLRIAEALWWYYFSKGLEFMDTFFFVLGKKTRNVSFLHVYHHSTMFPLWWMGAAWAPGGAAYLPTSLNAAVHVLMYSYYALAAYGAAVRGWKKYLTMLQMTQFFTAMGTTAFALYRVYSGQCKFYAWTGWMVLLYCVSMVLLFSQFYAQEYSTKDDKKKRL